MKDRRLTKHKVSNRSKFRKNLAYSKKYFHRRGLRLRYPFRTLIQKNLTYSSLYLVKNFSKRLDYSLGMVLRTRSLVKSNFESSYFFQSIAKIYDQTDILNFSRKKAWYQGKLRRFIVRPVLLRVVRGAINGLKDKRRVLSLSFIKIYCIFCLLSFVQI